MLQEWQWQLRGHTIGDDTDWVIQSVDGVGHPEVTTDDVDNVVGDGATVGLDRWGPRPLVIWVEHATDDAVALMQAKRELAAAWKTSDQLEKLVATLGGIELQLLVRPRGARWTEEPPTGGRRIRLEAFAPSPAWQSTTLQVLALPVPDDTGGVTWPIDWPAQWGASDTGIVEPANAGSADAPILWTVPGPKTNPTLVDVDRGVSLPIVGEVPDGSTLVVDTGTRTVELDGVDRSTWVAGDAGWPTVAAGGGRLKETSTASGATSSLAWRDTWMT